MIYFPAARWHVVVDAELFYLLVNRRSSGAEDARILYASKTLSVKGLEGRCPLHHIEYLAQSILGTKAPTSPGVRGLALENPGPWNVLRIGP